LEQSSVRGAEPTLADVVGALQHPFEELCRRALRRSDDLAEVRQCLARWLGPPTKPGASTSEYP
jgi:hypothetical protein